MTVTAEINIESPTGKCLVRELEKHSSLVKLSYPTPLNASGSEGCTYTFEEFQENVKVEFKKRYGVDFDKV